MSNKLDIMKVKVELLAVMTAKADLEYKIMQREEEVERLRVSVEASLVKENELNKKIAEMEAS